MTPCANSALLDVIAGRVGVRRFDPARPLDDMVLAQILQAATHAPSQGDLQPWRFIAVRSDSGRRKLRGGAFQHPALAHAPVALIALGYHHPHRTHLDSLIERQLAMGAITAAEAAEARARTVQSMERVPDLGAWAARATMMSVAVLAIAAEALGVGSAIIESFDREQVSTAFGVPDDHTVCCLIALGYPAQADPLPVRLVPEEVCYREHFGQPWSSSR